MKVEYISHMGNDLTVVNAARVSFNKESTWENNDEFTLGQPDSRLISYLARNGHWTPFSHPQITVRETVPIFIARQRFKHVVGFTYNEVSRRYVDETPQLFQPSVWRGRPTGSVKQGSEGVIDLSAKTSVFNFEDAQEHETLNDDVELFNELAIILYEGLLKANVSPEQARMVLPQSMYTSYYVTGSLYAWTRAYKQRSDPHAQQEIQDLASLWKEAIEPLFPVSWKALCEPTV